MRKILLLLFVLGFTVSMRAQDQLPGDTLMWRASRPLVPADFTGEPIESSSLMGEAFCLILTTFSWPADSTYTIISAQAVFDRTNSWISRRATPDEMLIFQVTFNIFEVYARKLRKEALQLHSDPFAQGVFQHKYAAAMPMLTHQCNELKRDTKMGADKARLFEWNDKVNKELKELEAYK